MRLILLRSTGMLKRGKSGEPLIIKY